MRQLYGKSASNLSRWMLLEMTSERHLINHRPFYDDSGSRIPPHILKYAMLDSSAGKQEHWAFGSVGLRTLLDRSIVRTVIFVLVVAIVVGLSMRWRWQRVLPIAAVPIVALYWPIRTKRPHWNDYRSHALSSCTCPACGYPLSDLPISSSNLTICAECGASWRLS